jgi:lysozyme
MIVMTPEMKVQLRHLLIEHEGYEQKLYQDSIGRHTIGIGRNLDDRGVCPTEIDMMCDHDMQYFYDQLDSHFTWFSHLNEPRQIALIDMCFMGFKKFLSFKKMIDCLSKYDYANAAIELLDSKYAAQVGRRAIDLAAIIKLGYLP